MALAGPAHALSDHQRQFVADVVQHGGVNADGMINGETQKTLAYLVARIQPKPPGPLPSTYAPSAWASMVDDYLITLAAAGQRESTIRHRRALLCRIARGLGCPPEQVTAEKLIDWFGRQQHWSPETRHSYRSVIRGFLAWGYRFGRQPCSCCGGTRWRCRSCHAVVLCAARDDPVPAARGAAAARKRRALPIRAELRY